MAVSTRARAQRESKLAAEQAAKRATCTEVAVVCRDFLNKDLSRGTGRAVAEAAPLVFQGMCRREGKRVFFTETPKTDGKSIWLGAIDFMNPLANVYVYGHGCHERHHVVYTDFRTVEKAQGEPLKKELLNVFEDIRVDQKGAEDYSGYLLWRRALFKACEASGRAPWVKSRVDPAKAFLLGLHLTLTSDILGISEQKKNAEKMLLKAVSAFGKELVDELVNLATDAFPLPSTEAALELAGALAGRIGDEMQSADDLLALLSNQQLHLGSCADLEGQGALFDDSGEVNGSAVPVASVPGLDKARKRAQALAGFADAERFTIAEEGDAVRELLTVADTKGHEQTLDSSDIRQAQPEEYARRWAQRSDEMRCLWRSAWMKSAPVRRLFQAALEHPLDKPERFAPSGFDLDDRRLALLGAGEDRVFLRDIPRRGREIAVKILVDTSGSMDSETITVAKVTAMRLMEAMRAEAGMRASVDLFPGATQMSVTRVSGWETSLRDAVPFIDFVEGFGQTPIVQALYTEGIELDARPEALKAVFVITDGFFQAEPVEDTLAMLRARGILTAMVGIGSTSTPMGRFKAKAETVEEIPKAVAGVVRDLTRALRKSRA